jgi:branched-chain amino acid transport system permease protein
MSRSLNKCLIPVLVLSLLLVPFLFDRFYIQFISKILVMIIFASSLNLLVGYTGLVSLGHAAFFGFSGYVLALLSNPDGPSNFFLSLTICIVATGCLGLIIGALVLRTRGIFFIMATLAFGEMLFYLLHDTDFAGGSDGMYLDHRPSFQILDYWQLDLSSVTHFYYVALVMMAISLFLIRTMLSSPYGRVINGIRINEHRTIALGYNTYLFKLVNFTVAAMIASLAGFLSAAQFGVVNPEMVGWHLSGHVLMMVIFGGLGTLLGPILGAASMMFLEEIFQVITKHWQLMTGIVIVGVALFMPRGLAGIRFPSSADKQTNKENHSS